MRPQQGARATLSKTLHTSNRKNTETFRRSVLAVSADPLRSPRDNCFTARALMSEFPKIDQVSQQQGQDAFASR